MLVTLLNSIFLPVPNKDLEYSPYDGGFLQNEGVKHIIKTPKEDPIWRDWNTDYPPMKKEFLVKGWLKREVFYCDYPIECDDGNERNMEIWSIVPLDQAYTWKKEIYLGVTSWAVIYTKLPEKKAYPISDSWGYNLREIANNDQEYDFFIYYNTPENWEWRSYNSQVQDRKLVNPDS